MVLRKGKKNFYKKKEEKEEKEEQEEEVESGDEHEDEEEEDKKPQKKLKTSATTSKSTKSSSSSSDNNDKSIEIGGRRKISYSEFGGAPKIDIREFYLDKSTNELKPGTKGISLTFEQFQAIADNIDTILSWTKKK